jgi:hypothetical protein
MATTKQTQNQKKILTCAGTRRFGQAQIAAERVYEKRLGINRTAEDAIETSLRGAAAIVCCAVLCCALCPERCWWR